MSTLTLPRRQRGRPTAAAEDRYLDELLAWSQGIKEIRATLDFQVDTRGWSYLLETHGLAKGDFAASEKLITDCRKGGILPLDICAVDGSRASEGEEVVNDANVEGFAGDMIFAVLKDTEGYTPISFWEGQDTTLNCSSRRSISSLSSRRSAAGIASSMPTRRVIPICINPPE